MMAENQEIKIAIDCIKASLKLIGEGKPEDAIRHSFTSYLRLLYPDMPRWIELHIAGSEEAVKYVKEGQLRTGFVDNLVELTAIEYESDITIQAKFKEGYAQLKNYCASLLNKKIPPDLISGILSDTIHWRVYKISSIATPKEGIYGGEDIELEENMDERIDLSAADEIAAKQLLRFLSRNLGRMESRPLNVSSIAKDMGLESKFCEKHLTALSTLVEEAFKARPQYAEMITRLWCRFVNYLRESDVEDAFEMGGYTAEIYLLTLAKLICANVISGRALISNGDELRDIICGEYFKRKGFINLVEHDYFGWINSKPFLDQLLPIARDIQDDLKAYDFKNIPSEDMFSQMFAQLAQRTRRILLGQECTPGWLAKQMVEKVVSSLPDIEQPRLVDMCCGSGTIIVEAMKTAKNKIAQNLSTQLKEARINELSKAVTGFDIDPLAVILSKINWILAAGDWLEPLGAFPVIIPIYHADSLFAITPLSNMYENREGQSTYSLQIAEYNVDLPSFLISPEYQQVFDSIIDSIYNLVITAGNSPLEIDEQVLGEIVERILSNINIDVEEDRCKLIKGFIKSASIVIDKLNKEDKNGIWTFILRNSYRPGLVRGYFNGLVSNPPWLALSKIANNPYQDVLKEKVDEYGIKPPGPSFLHVEMATIFLLHAVENYLKEEAQVACIVPDSVLNGYHHDPFRRSNYAKGDRPIHFQLSEIWRVQEHTFKNRAIVLIGQKEKPLIDQPNPIPGGLAQENGRTPLTFYRLTRGRRTAWSDQQSCAETTEILSGVNFRQGADIMPRTMFFHELSEAPPVSGIKQWQVRQIDVSSSNLAFAIKDAKKHRDFAITPCILPDDLIFDVLTSNLLTPFDLARPLKALLPIIKNSSHTWEALSDAALSAKGSAAVLAFKQIGQALGNGYGLSEIWKLINTRSKLSQQEIRSDGIIVLTGTSGGIVCSTYVEAAAFDINKLIIDQTLNWAEVGSIDEAIYLVGLFNSEAINIVIRDFQPEGEYGKRHIHSLPFRVTPSFDIKQSTHQAVLHETKLLITEYLARKEADERLVSALDPNRSSLPRRRLLITNILKQLPSYKKYSTVCKALYGVKR